MKKIRELTKKLIIYIVLIMIILSSIAPTKVYARNYDDACGQYVSKYAKDFISTYCEPKTNTKYAGCSKPSWSGSNEFEGKFTCCCTAGVWYMYKLALGIDIYELGFSSSSGTAIEQMKDSNNWVKIEKAEDIKPGDILISSAGHTEMYVGSYENANFGNVPYSGVIASGGPDFGDGKQFDNAFRLDKNINVNPSRKNYRCASFCIYWKSN